MSTTVNREAIRAAELMRVYGGSFAKAIGSAYLCADPGHKLILEQALHHLFSQYSANSRWASEHREQQEACL